MSLRGVAMCFQPGIIAAVLVGKTSSITAGTFIKGKVTLYP